MSKLEELTPNASVRGILPDALVTVINVHWFGSRLSNLPIKTRQARSRNELLYRHDEARIAVVEQGLPWNFDGDGNQFRLVSKPIESAWRTFLTRYSQSIPSIVDPLPHQITAVYDAMLPRQPLRSSWRMILEQAKPLWQGSLSRS